MNFHELAQKLRRIDEGSVVECGDMMPGAMMAPHAPMPQQDTVSMNVSMNATGKGGIRDLMNVLQNIESAVNHGDMYKPLDIDADEIELDIPSADSMMGGEVHIEPEMDEPEMDEPEIDADDSESPIDGDEFGSDDTFGDETDTFGDEEPKQAKTIDPAVAAVVGYLASKNKKSDIETVTDESGNFENRPDPSYQSPNYMTKTIAQGQRMTKGGYRNADNPLAMKEGLQGRLANLYQEVKLREGKERTMSRAAKGVMKYGKKGMQALAKAGKEGKDLDKVRDKYNKYDEGFEQMPQNTTPAPTMPAMPAQKPANPNDYSAIKRSPEWKQLQANLEAAISAGDPDSLALAKAMQDIKTFTAKMGLNR
jgi:hypothetical protein